MRPEQRASDAERELVVARLRDACADGRLTADELAERVAAAYAARTYVELDRLTADLPRGQPLPVSRRPRVPGERAFAERVVSPASREHVAGQVIARLGPLLGERGFHLVSHDDRAIVFERAYRPAWTIAAAILIPIFGLLALAHKERMRIVVALAPAQGGGTEVTLYGRAPLGLRRALAELSA